MLPFDTSRCLGLLPGLGPLIVIRCTRRDTCQRYTDRAAGDQFTPVSQWLCPGKDDYFESYIKVTK